MGESKSSSQTVTFDLTTQPGVMQALYAVRTSDLGTQEKNTLRDQIFTYTKSGGDERLREQIESKLQTVPLAKAFLDVYRAKAKTAAKPGFAGGRRAPSFAVPPAATTSTDTPAPAETPEPAAPAPQPEAKPEPAPEPEPTPDPTPEPAAAPQPTPAAKAAPTPPAAPQSAPAAPENNVKPEATPQSAPAPTAAPQAAPTPDPEPTGAANADAYSIERIREIKRYINNKIGNPVNLVDINNDLGRAYMSALLAAMQSVNAETGRAGANEMQELERIFQQVQPLLQDGAPATTETATGPASASSLPTATPSTDTPAPAETPEPAAPKPEAKPEPAAPAPEPVTPPTPPTPKPAAPQPKAAPTPPAAPQSAPEPAPSAANTAPAAQSKPEPAPQPTPDPTPTAPAEPVRPVAPVASMGSEKPQPSESAKSHVPMPAVEATGAAADEDDAAVPMPTEEATPRQPVRPPLGIGEVPSKSVPRNDVPDNLPGAANADPVNNYSVGQEASHSLSNQLTELDKKAAAANEHHGDPLHAQEVEAGLEQLLQEWNLFKSSGLFGTGPNGREHPLYQKLAPMMIQDVAQGRFADARPEVTQSITDYMNGWRYEQGIVYEPGESFETYLRRVIRFIIDSKK